MAVTESRAEKTSLKRKVFRMPSISPLPKNWAPKMLAPLRPPKMASICTIRTELAMEAAEIASVPRLPTMTLSSRETKEEMNCCTRIGISRVRTLL